MSQAQTGIAFLTGRRNNYFIFQVLEGTFKYGEILRSNCKKKCEVLLNLEHHLDKNPSKTLQAFITNAGPKRVRWFGNIQIITWSFVTKLREVA